MDSEKERAKRIAKSLGTSIPDEMRFSMWPLPILEKLVDRVSDLERQLQSRHTMKPEETQPTYETMPMLGVKENA